MKQLIDVFLHLDVHLNAVISAYGAWTYGILFVIIFCETGLVVTPFLPGDSLLFAAGTFAAAGSLEAGLVLLLLTAAAVLGDAVNYIAGKFLGPKVLTGNSRIFKREYLDRTRRFYERYGSKTIVMARFVPIVRTFAPFLAGVGDMSYAKFATYNIVGAFLWVVICTGAGYLFGNLPFVKQNFSVAILAIIFISVLPALIEFWRDRRSVS
jgi:membrane-associated protein